MTTTETLGRNIPGIQKTETTNNILRWASEGHTRKFREVHRITCREYVVQSSTLTEDGAVNECCNFHIDFFRATW